MKTPTIKNYLFAVVLAVLLNLNLTAQVFQFSEVKKPFDFPDAEDKPDYLFEPSAVEKIDNEGRYLLVADDKSDASPKNLRIVRTADGKLIKRFQLPDTPAKTKWEALAKDRDGYFYLIGSHAAKDTDSPEKLADRSHLFRFRLTSNDDPAKIELDPATPIIEFDIKSSLKKLQLYTAKPSEQNVKIEGLAIRQMGGKKFLIFGFREPSPFVQVYSAELPAETTEPVRSLSLNPLFKFGRQTTADQTPFKLSSIEYVADWKGFLIITSSETTTKSANGKDQPVFHGNALWFVADNRIKPASKPKVGQGLPEVEPQKIAEFERDLKAEGFCLIESGEQKRIRLVIVFDNDTEDFIKAKAEKYYPGMLQIVEITNKSR